MNSSWWKPFKSTNITIALLYVCDVLIGRDTLHNALRKVQIVARRLLLTAID